MHVCIAGLFKNNEPISFQRMHIRLPQCNEMKGGQTDIETPSKNHAALWEPNLFSPTEIQTFLRRTWHSKGKQMLLEK